MQLNCTFHFDERKLSPDPLAPKGFAIGSARALPCAAAAAACAGPVLTLGAGPFGCMFPLRCLQ